MYNICSQGSSTPPIARTFSHLDGEQALVVDRGPGFLLVVREGVREVLEPQQGVFRGRSLVRIVLKGRDGNGGGVGGGG